LPARSNSLAVSAPRDITDLTVVREDTHESRLRRLGLHDPSPPVEVETCRIESNPGPPETDDREGDKHDAQAPSSAARRVPSRGVRHARILWTARGTVNVRSWIRKRE
jgi:hypothetical protein